MGLLESDIIHGTNNYIFYLADTTMLGLDLASEQKSNLFFFNQRVLMRKTDSN